jgi:3-dehydroquinate dehydratase-2
MKILIINGPNMQLLGKREPHIYGTKTLTDLQNDLSEFTADLNVELSFFQSNHEGEIIDKIALAAGEINGIVINPAAYTHTSIAIHDAIKGVGIPTVEVHLSNINAREGFRHQSCTAPACIGQICGFGFGSYKLAIQALMMALNES